MGRLLSLLTASSYRSLKARSESPHLQGQSQAMCVYFDAFQYAGPSTGVWQLKGVSVIRRHDLRMPPEKRVGGLLDLRFRPGNLERVGAEGRYLLDNPRFRVKKTEESQFLSIF